MQYSDKKIGKEISALSRYYDSFTQVTPLTHDDLNIFEIIDCKEKRVFKYLNELPKVSPGSREIYFLNGNFNHDTDIQSLLEKLKPSMSPESRVFALAYNPYIKPLYMMAKALGFRTAPVPNTFITEDDIRSICSVAGFELVRLRPCIYMPYYIPWISNLINFLMPMIPLVRKTSLISLLVLRPKVSREDLPSVSIIVPARNEKGNIEDAVTRMPDFGGAQRELIYVEGHSSDGTWEEIQRVQVAHGSKFKIHSYQQTGKGKSDAVRLGFEKATNELMFILDADLTMPPEMMTRFYEAYRNGHGDFLNGSRLIYPMESKAMKPLNFIGNKFFAKFLSFTLDNYISDSLCGTKVFTKRDYLRMIKWREDFGDFDPFGDFELLFPAAQLGFKITDIPIKYKNRVYGETQISRFTHGFMLLRMTLIGLFKIKAGFRG